jgi:hypothetical protein
MFHNPLVALIQATLLVGWSGSSLFASKLERNIQLDRDDVKHLARTVPLDPELLKQRYQRELRWQLGNPGREDLTLRLWLDAMQEEKSK